MQYLNLIIVRVVGKADGGRVEREDGSMAGGGREEREVGRADGGDQDLCERIKTCKPERL
jgi:hypothetical protein